MDKYKKVKENVNKPSSINLILDGQEIDFNAIKKKNKVFIEKKKSTNSNSVINTELDNIKNIAE